ncbi:hypothetical protein Psi01_20880 [Planobispora siamensis]|uniref:Uncharacterized protein n=1 Tax=Planobispora siamensis TaxID=936338 RepID=A0A8J3WJB0_9ACTN|nr:hypothetical protein Psi01_20880 [Planobispora siamensis]
MLMDSRPEKNPGTFKSRINRAGLTESAFPALVDGTLRGGFALTGGLTAGIRLALPRRAARGPYGVRDDGRKKRLNLQPLED